MVIVCTGTLVNMMTRYFDMARLTVQSSETVQSSKKVFRGIVHYKGG